MQTNPYSAPNAKLDTLAENAITPALWNPKVISVLGFFLSPIFGSIMLMKNWQAMGEPEKARQSMYWAVGTILFYAAMIVLVLALPESSAESVPTRGASIGLFAAWYMTSCKVQKDIVAVRFGTDFPKRGWALPILYGIGGYIGLVGIFALAIGLS